MTDLTGGVPPIPNEVLRKSDVPEPRDDWPTLFCFALTYDGHTRAGTDRRAELANSTLEKVRGGVLDLTDLDLDDLRTCLFFEQRRWPHFGGAPQGQDAAYFHTLLDAIREKAR